MSPSTPTRPVYPISAVVGQEELILALVLAAVDRGIGGVLLRGQKGSAKTTAARGLAALLPGAAPFVELPVGASEDRVVGSVDLRGVLRDGEQRLSPGLLAGADGGVLYVDEVNLLPDHLVDVLLDVAASGINRVEREGVSHEHSSRFVLLGSMNPEEGELRPQFLDRFGLAVAVTAPVDPVQRAEAVQRRLDFEADPAGFVARWAEPETALAQRLAAARPAPLAPGLVEQVARLCVAVGAEGLRGDLVCCRAAGALAGWEGRPWAGDAEVRRVAAAALAHRRRRSPFESPELADEELQAALDEAFKPVPPAPPPATPTEAGSSGTAASTSEQNGPSGQGGADGRRTEVPERAGGGAECSGAGGRSASSGEGPVRPEGDGNREPEDRQWGHADRERAGRSRQAQDERHGPDQDAVQGENAVQDQPEANGSFRHREVMATPAAVAWAGKLLDDGRRAATQRTGDAPVAGRRSLTTADRGRQIGSRVPDGAVSSIAVGATVRAAAARGSTQVQLDDLRQSVAERRTGQLVVLAVDASGSMGAQQRMASAVGAALALLVDAYQRRDRVALVTFGGESATVALAPTGSIEVARARLSALTTGGRTPLAAGIAAALEVAGGARRSGHRPVVVLITDGRATAGPPGADPLDAALAAAGEVRRAEVRAVVIDAEDGPTRLGLAAELAEVMGARCVVPGALTGDRIVEVVRAELGTPGAAPAGRPGGAQ